MSIGTPVRLTRLRSYQCAPGRAIVESALNRRGLTLTVVMARQAGKNELSAHLELFLLSAEPAANVVGHTASLLLEVDEAQDVEREKFDREFRPMAAMANATTVYYGTPWDDTTLLEQAVQSNLELERRDGVRRHFQYDWQAVTELN